MISWTIDGQSLEAMGVQSLRFAEANQEHSTVVLTLTDRGQPKRAWVRWQKVEIRKDGEVFFVGWIDSADSAEDGGQSGKQIVIKGPWMWLEETTFSRRIEQAAGGGFATSAKLFKKGGQRLTVIDQIIEVINCAVVASGSQFSIGQISPGEVPDLPPEEWVSAQSCADVFRRVAAWAPSACVWIGQGIAPTLNWTHPGARKTHSFTKGFRPLVSASVRPESAMAPASVVIQYNSAQNEFDGVSYPIRQDAFPLNAEAGNPGAAVFVLGSEEDRRQPWAQQIYNLARQWLWSGDVELILPSERVLPGDLVALSGRSEWQGCEAVVQTVNMDAQSDRWSVTLGPPSHLGLSDLRDLLWWMKRGQNRTVDEPILNLHPWQVYPAFNPLSFPFLKDVKMASAVVNFGAGEIIPIWRGQPLGNEDTSEPLTRGYKRDFVLEIEWRPDVAKFVTYDLEGNEFQNWRAVSTGRIVSAKIGHVQRDNIAPVVNLKNGAVSVQGKFYFLIAQASEEDGELKVTQHRLTGLQTIFVPPNYLYLIE